VSVVSDKVTNQIRLKIAGASLNIHTEDTYLNNKGEENLTCEYKGEDILIGFNSKTLIDVFSNLKSEEIIFAMSEPNKAAIIYPANKEEDKDILMLVMPVIL